MQPIKFSYRDADGRESVRTLTHWSENTRYLQGRGECDTLPRTFRKGRVVEYLEGAGQRLFDKAPPHPSRLQRQRSTCALKFSSLVSRLQSVRSLRHLMNTVVLE